MKAGEAPLTAAGAPRDARETAERVKLLFRFSPEGYLTSAVVGAAVAFFLLNEVSDEGLAAWLAWVLLVCAGRYALYKTYSRRIPPVDAAPAWERYFTAGSALMGLAWAALPAVLFPERSTEYQLVVTFIVAVMAMGAVGTLGPSLLAFACFVAPMVFAMVVRLFLQGGAAFVGIAVVALFYVALLARIWKEFNQALTGTIRARFENEDLINKLRHSQDVLGDEQALIYEGTTTGIAFIRERAIVRCNRRFAAMYGYVREELIGRPARLLYGSSEGWEQVSREGYTSIERGETYESEIQSRKRNGDLFWTQITGRLIDPADAAKGSIWVVNDVDGRRRTEDALKAALLEEQRIMDTATVGIVFLKELRVVKCNRHFALMFAYAQEELIGHSSAIWYPSVDAWQKAGSEAYATVERGEPYEFEQECVKKSGERFWCHVAGRMLDARDPARGSIWVYTDVTERKTREEEIRALAHHDALTALPNRRLLDDRMTQAFASARRSGEHVALMLLDLDRFKPVNDNYGHEAGDAVLKVVGARLKGCVREADTVARIGGDEFVVMLLVHVPNDAVRVAEKILASLAQPIPVAGNEFRIGASIGISVYPEDATEQDALINCADRAMYYVKAAGRNAYRFYATEQAPVQT